ncbi:right-handed parallel beta-helix repeat-containing protein, partial [Dehalococcoidia bacterium]|nr:right-handed parallel beta-helix repeat-containing protein [Dehalococcoidia bacterium]
EATISANGVAVRVRHSAQVGITGSDISGNGWTGIEIRDSAQAVIAGSAISENVGPGIALSATAQAVITGSTISENRDGAWLRNSAHLKITGSAVSGSQQDGFILRNSAYLEVTDSTISRNERHGINLLNSAHAVVTGSTIRDNQEHGVKLSCFAHGEITDNLIKGNGRGGIISLSDRPLTGGNNTMLKNGLDLLGNLPSGLRKPLMEPVEWEIRLPDPAVPTLQHAVDALLPGGRLILGEGSYTGGVTIGKDLTIIAKEGAKPRIEGGFAVISLARAARVKIDGLLLRDGWMGLAGGTTTQIEITDSTISENKAYGIKLWDSAQAVITDSTISRNEKHGVLLLNSAQTTITGSTISDNGWNGIELRDWAQAEITGSTFSENSVHGIKLWDSAQALLRGNTAINNRYGVSAIQLVQGYIAGSANTIPGPGEPGGNHINVIPARLCFLMTEEGGEYRPVAPTFQEPAPPAPPVPRHWVAEARRP